MFYYYGGKRTLARWWPTPRHRLLIEPFAGSAAYAMRHLAWVDEILLIEKDVRVVELWERLLAMTPEQVRALPVPEVGEYTDDYFYMTAATSNAIANLRRLKVTDRLPRIVEVQKEQVARLLPQVQGKVRIVHGDYTEAPDVPACWFIDPPYRVTNPSVASVYRQGLGYAPGCKSTDLDYAALADWCRAREGQVMVCEMRGAAWLPFQPVRKGANSLRREHFEVGWINEQTRLFGIPVR